jgi:hypothetical protein
MKEWVTFTARALLHSKHQWCFKQVSNYFFQLRRVTLYLSNWQNMNFNSSNLLHIAIMCCCSCHVHFRSSIGEQSGSE